MIPTVVTLHITGDMASVYSGTEGVFHLDFSRALDTISDSILLKKLAVHGLDRCALGSVKNWLDGCDALGFNFYIFQILYC